MQSIVARQRRRFCCFVVEKALKNGEESLKNSALAGYLAPLLFLAIFTLRGDRKRRMKRRSGRNTNILLQKNRLKFESKFCFGLTASILVDRESP